MMNEVKSRGLNVALTAVDRSEMEADARDEVRTPIGSLPPHIQCVLVTNEGTL